MVRSLDEVVIKIYSPLLTSRAPHRIPVGPFRASDEVLGVTVAQIKEDAHTHHASKPPEVEFVGFRHSNEWGLSKKFGWLVVEPTPL